MIGQSGEVLGGPDFRIDVVELSRLDQRVDCGGGTVDVVGTDVGRLLRPAGLSKPLRMSVWSAASQTWVPDGIGIIVAARPERRDHRRHVGALQLGTARP